MNSILHPRLAKAFFAFALMLATTVSMAAENLGPGSPAPKIAVKRWLKGKPIARLESKGIYVIEFWATWCGPCIESIPHVTELAKRNPDVGFLGVGIWEEDESDNLTKFVTMMGDKMGYTVGYSGNKDGMAATWMEPAALRGIPSAFIVKDHQIMWIGHPMAMDKPLEEIKRGTFDLPKFKRTYEQRAEKERLQMAVDAEHTAVLKLFEDGKREEAKKALATFVTKHPEYAEGAERVRYGWLADEDHDAWLAKTKEMLATGEKEQLQKVASFALRRAQTPAGAPLARTAIAMVLEANRKDDYDLLIYGRSIYLKLKDYKEALQVTNKMIDLYPKDPPDGFAVQKDLLLKSKAELEAKLAGN